MPAPAYPLINGHRFDFSSIEFNLNAVRSLGVTEIEYEDDLEPGEVRANRAQVYGFTRGQYKARGKITMLKEEADIFLAALVVSGGGGYMEAVFTAVVSYAEALAGQLQTDVLEGARVVKVSDRHTQGNEGLKVEFELVMNHITRNGKSPLSALQLVK